MAIKVLPVFDYFICVFPHIIFCFVLVLLLLFGFFLCFFFSFSFFLFFVLFFFFGGGTGEQKNRIKGQGNKRIIILRNKAIYFRGTGEQDQIFQGNSYPLPPPRFEGLICYAVF